MSQIKGHTMSSVSWHVFLERRQKTKTKDKTYLMKTQTHIWFMITHMVKCFGMLLYVN